nr:unnamed protein product [Digitaria exilis]
MTTASKPSPDFAVAFSISTEIIGLVFRSASAYADAVTVSGAGSSPARRDGTENQERNESENAADEETLVPFRFRARPADPKAAHRASFPPL